MFPDRLGRPLRNLRISVTDRCNLRCQYCMPEETYKWLPRKDILSFEEIGRLVDVFLDLGVDKLRLTGGEPLLRRDLPVLIRDLAGKSSLRDLALTTNGMLLPEMARPLREAGLHRITVSLDTLRADRFLSLTRRDGLEETLAGIAAVSQAGFEASKLDTVVMRDINADELIDLIEFGRGCGFEVRFIEYMDVGGATDWSLDKVVSRREILAGLEQHFGSIEAQPKTDSAPADRFRLRDGTLFGVISSTTEPFCGSCDRSRLTADGMWYLCLYAREGVNLGGALRDGATNEELAELIRRSWAGRSDQGAIERLQAEDRGRWLATPELREDPHLEMHTRGG